MADWASLMVQLISLGFAISGYPGSGRRIESERDLAGVSRPDLIQGAFMGDAIIELGQEDFSTRFGWVTLLDWCLSLSSTIRTLKGACSSHFRFAESDDFMAFRRDDERLYVACSYRPGIASVPSDEFAGAVRSFVGEKLRWMSVNHPRAMMNPAMRDVLAGVELDRPYDQ